jgi:hypothetical protein
MLIIIQQSAYGPGSSSNEGADIAQVEDLGRPTSIREEALVRRVEREGYV